jgi:hypothetical protein
MVTQKTVITCLKNGVRFQERIFLFATAFRSDVGPTQPPLEWDHFLGDKRGSSVKLTAHFHPVPRLKMRGAFRILF